MEEIRLEDCGSCIKSLKKLLNKIKDTNEEVTIIIQSGEDCCDFTGCICEINDCFLVLVDGDNICVKTYILLDKICAVIHPAKGCHRC
ncbi:hypothetical protein BX659_12059 [Orenia metallireducens]|jgi:hypothetical protein|uniref:Uncharacterized protein n=1 Tax=Orenia metallireducens TaxID=1413210 RepID=A0A285GZ91_9FIRM|nr:hypothetical protein [Orenia metallireducens]PRX26468.1 hypothetical protein BX659_12059 [Orenia metallireducens]SNY28832.1 hypothetical protein SAMN06265827_11259 [Orenia metallireducens]